MGERKDRNTKNINIGKLAIEVLKAAQSKIVANMRFMDSAVFALKKKEASFQYQTDGKILRYEPSFVLQRCSSGLGEATHDYMHIILHCIFKHYFIRGKMNSEYWNLATDIAVEELINSFDAECFDASRTKEQKSELDNLRRDYGRLSAEKLYRAFLDEPPAEKECIRLSNLFKVDDHGLWYRNSKSDSEDDSCDGDAYIEEGELELPDEESEKYSEGASLEADIDWDKIGDYVKTAIEMKDQEMGVSGGKLLSELEEIREEKIDYSTFLRKFATRRETLKVDDNSFDYIYYTYGLDLYGDMPLVEPLEYSDEKQIRDMVIALDTSGSTDGPPVRAFIRKTFDILQNTDVIKSKFNIHVIQCDAEVQEDITLKSKDDVEKYISNMEIKGLGGTDFRPVFTYIDKLIENGEINDLRGLLYFTDGKGIYPKKKPAYDTAFVFVGDKIDDTKVPVWAMKVKFDENGNGAKE